MANYYFYGGKKITQSELMTLKRQKKITYTEFRGIVNAALEERQRRRPKAVQEALDRLSAPARLARERKEAEEERKRNETAANASSQANSQPSTPKFKQYTLEQIKTMLPGISDADASGAMNAMNTGGFSAYMKWAAAYNNNKASVKPATPPAPLTITDIEIPPAPLSVAQQFINSLTELSVGYKAVALELQKKNVFQDKSELDKYLANPTLYISTWKPAPPPKPVVQTGAPTVTTAVTPTVDPVTVNVTVNTESSAAERSRIEAEGANVETFGRATVTTSDLEAGAIAEFRARGFKGYAAWAREYSEKLKRDAIVVVPSSQPTVWDSQLRRIAVNFEAQREKNPNATPPVVTEQQVLSEGQRIFKEKGYDAYVAWARQYSVALNNNQFTVERSEERSKALKDALRGSAVKIVRSDGEDYTARNPYGMGSDNKGIQDALKRNRAIIGQEKQSAQIIQWRLTPATKPVVPSSNISSFVLSNIEALSGDSPYKSLLLAMLLRRYTNDDIYTANKPSLVDAAKSRQRVLTAAIKINRYSIDDQYVGVRSDISDLNKEFEPANENKYTKNDKYAGVRSDITDLNKEYKPANENEYSENDKYVAGEESRLTDLNKEFKPTNENKYSKGAPYNKESTPNLDILPEPKAIIGTSNIAEDAPSPITRVLSFFRSFLNPKPTTAAASNSNSSELTSSAEQPYDERKAETTGLKTLPSPDVLQDLLNVLLPESHPKSGGRPVFDQLYTNNRRVTPSYPEGEMAGVSLRGVQEGSAPSEEGTLSKVFSYVDDRKHVHGVDRGFTQNINAASPRTAPAVQQTDALQRVAGVIGAGYQQYFPFLFETENRKVAGGSYKKQTCFLQATLNQMQESYAPNWTSKSFFGRTEKVHTYTETDRVLDIQFVIFADSIRQLQNTYERVNWLAQQTYGQYEAYGQSVNKLGSGPLVRLTIGDIFQRVPGYIRNLSLNWDHSGAGGKWEITEGLKMPVSCQVSLSYQIIHPDMPDRDMNFYWGLAKGMGGGLIPTNRDKEGSEDSYVREIAGAIPVSDHEVDQYSTFYSNNEVPAPTTTQAT